MKPRHFASAAKVFLPLLCLVSLCLFSPPMVRGEGILPAAMPNYCAEPPFAAAGIKSNLLLMLDNSASMYDVAYTNPLASSKPSHACLDDSYQDGKTYGGYFEPGVNYQYQAGRFVAVAGPLPTCSSGVGSCAASTSYLYLQMTPAVAPDTLRMVSSFTATGNFLNWLSASKLDIQRKVLTGGKFLPDAGSTTRGVLQAESRGCQGKRFVKMLKGVNVTFVVRGPTLPELGFAYDTSRGGETTIEIYDGAYRQTECRGAIDAWLAASDSAVVKAQVNKCIDTSMRDPSPHTGTMPGEGVVFTYIMGLCYDSLSNSVTNEARQGLWSLCTERYIGLFGPDFETQQLTAVDGICGRNIKHSSGLGGSVGFVGKCAEGGDGAQMSNCLLNQVTDYCNEVRNSTVTDPSSTATMAGGRTQIPSYIIDAGVYNLGKPSGTFNARLSLDSPPVGLLQRFSTSINFGALLFNGNGASPAECAAAGIPCVKHCRIKPFIDCLSDSDCNAVSGGRCIDGTDGAMVSSYLNDAASPLGNHASGLIGAINSIKASTWTPYAEAFYNAIGYYARRTDLRLAAADFDLAKPAPSQYVCQKNNILIVSDGLSTADSNAYVEAVAALYATGRETVTGNDGSSPNLPSRSLDDLAWIAAHRDIRSFSKTAASTAPPATPDRSITTHVIFTGSSNGAPGEADPATLMRRTAESGRGIFATASDPAALGDQMLMVLRQVASGTGSGTDVSIQSGGGNGALFLQGRYFSGKTFDGDTSASWIGEMQGLWYYIDPFIANSSGGGSTVREDTVADGRLKLGDDRALLFGNETVSAFYDRNGDGVSDGAAATLSPDAVNALWRAGRRLWSRDLVTEPRRIFTPLLPGGTAVGNTGLMRFSFVAPDHAAVLQPYLQQTTAADAEKVIKYVHGFDFPGDSAMRSRTVRIGDIPAPAVTSKADDPYVTNPRDRGIGVWKLGDIISSTAKVASATPLSSFDLPVPRGYGDSSYRSYITSNQYRDRGMIFLGANDGMLHAFNMGRLKAGSGAETAVLDPGGAALGHEEWAFIPRNVLPYLTYLREPAYQHLYLVDGPVTLADVSIGDTGSSGCLASSYWSCPKSASVWAEGSKNLDPAKNTWRTVLIASMGLGGASADSCSAGAPCVPTPIPDPAASTKRIGYSSYFALDVTDPANPALLWEFSHPDLGYSTTGPAIVRIGDPKLNGRWFAVFGSGPTGPVREQQFLGESEKGLRFFVVDLRSGELIDTIDTGIPKAFAGSMSGGVIDDRQTKLVLLDGSEKERKRYQDDAIYVGYTAFHQGTGSWSRGGVGRIMIKDLPDQAQPAGANLTGIWQWSRVMGYHPGDAANDSTGPVTTGVVRLQDSRYENLWLYFGTGRYYYRSFQQDDFSGQRAIYGVKEPCYTNRGSGYLDKTCSATVCGTATTECLANQTTGIATVDRGWRIDLEPASGALGAERVIVDPVSMTGGAVFFPTFQPSATPCRMGNSFLWGVRYDTGDAIPPGWLQGKVLMQLSTGELRETVPGDLNANGKRRGAGIPDSRPGGIKVVTNSGLRPLRKIIHIQER